MEHPGIKPSVGLLAPPKKMDLDKLMSQGVESWGLHDVDNIFNGYCDNDLGQGISACQIHTFSCFICGIKPGIIV